jgi:hypothetical protein
MAAVFAFETFEVMSRIDVKRTFKKWHPEKNDRHAVVSPNVNSHWKTRLPTRKNAVAGGPMGL